jgi:peptidoglycan/LPS O-acetylase OafA/YrhL
VDLFFVISGFLIGSLLFKEFLKAGDICFGRFYVRRFLRLIPVYVVVMLLGMPLMRDIPKSAILMDMPPSGNAENLWANLLYVNNFLPFAKQYMGWCWSLAIEEQFYLLAPAALVLFLRLGRGRVRILVALLAFSGVLRWVVLHANGFDFPYLGTPDSASWHARFDIAYDKPHMRYGGLLAGIIGAYLTCYRKEGLRRFFENKRLVAPIALGSLGLMVHVAYTRDSSTMFGSMPVWAGQAWIALSRDVFAMAAMFLILTATFTPELFGGWLRRILAWKAFYPVAQLSYSIYLVHEIVFLWLFPKMAPLLAGRLGAYGTMAVDSLVGLVLVLGLSSLLYVTVERPCMEMRSLPWIRGLGSPKDKAGTAVA